jgi:hypothetical protein
LRIKIPATNRKALSLVIDTIRAEYINGSQEIKKENERNRTEMFTAQ